VSSVYSHSRVPSRRCEMAPYTDGSRVSRRGGPAPGRLFPRWRAPSCPDPLLGHSRQTAQEHTHTHTRALLACHRRALSRSQPPPTKLQPTSLLSLSPSPSLSLFAAVRYPPSLPVSCTRTHRHSIWLRRGASPRSLLPPPHDESARASNPRSTPPPLSPRAKEGAMHAWTEHVPSRAHSAWGPRNARSSDSGVRARKRRSAASKPST
jgi:hypothetical protein